MEELIKTKARELFFSYGLKSVSMDDISRDAAVSKKTIYKSFADKNELVQQLVAEFLECFNERLEQCKKQSNNSIEEVILSSEMMVDVVTKVTSNFFHELRKFFPAIWKSVEEHTNNVLVPFIRENLRKGIDEEVYRSDLDTSFTIDVRLQQITTVLEVKTASERLIQAHKLMMQLTDFYLHAIATPKGKLIIKYIKEYNEKQFSN